MRLRISELKRAMTRRVGVRITNRVIQDATGVTVASLSKMDNGLPSQIRSEYVNALAKYFSVSPCELIELGEVELPLPRVRGRAR